jgi:23S rRNA (uracil1939-C5)-methyltransferase
MTVANERFVCVHETACGACPLLGLTYTEQLHRKGARVWTCAGRYPALRSLEVAPAAPATPRAAYRVRAKLMVAAGGRVGLFGAEGDHQVIDTDGCLVLAPSLTSVLAVLRPMIARDEAAGEGAPLAPRVQPTMGPGLLAVDLRELQPPSRPGEAQPGPRVLVTWVIARGPSFRLERFRDAATELCQAAPEVLGVAVNFHEGEGPQVLGKETMLLVGKSWGLDALGASSHRATFGSFVQAHRGQAARVHRLIAAAIFGPGAADGAPDAMASRGTRPRVLDLYGGSGAIALGLAAGGADVLMVESFAPAVQQAQESARAAGLTLKAECADVAVALARLARRPGGFDAAVVNPPRRGLEPAVRVQLARLAVDTLVYVSCQPETLTRDLDHFARLGFVTRDLQPVDMIPLTEEVETVAVLRRAPGGELASPVVLYDDAEVVVVDKSPHEPTTPQGEYEGSLLGRVKLLAGCANAVPVHRLDVGTSGVVIFAKNPAHVSAWSSALLADDARKIYFAAVRGVPESSGMIDRPLTIEGKVKQAHTQFERERVIGSHTLLRVVPDEGRTHQIRRHLAAIGHPVLGDDRYGHAATNRFVIEKHGLDRTFLHAARLELKHPSTGRRLVIEAPLAGDLAGVVQSVSETKAARLRVATP